MPPRPEQVRVDIPVLEPASVASSSEPQPPARRDSNTEPPPKPRSSSTLGVIGLGIAGAGLVGVGVGAFLGLRAQSTYDDSFTDDHCLADNRCDDTGKDRRASARSLATGSTIAFIAGGAALAGGLVLFFVAPKGESRAAVRPMVGPSVGGLAVSGAF